MCGARLPAWFIVSVHLALGQETASTRPQVSDDDNREYLCSLYERCINSKKKTEEDLAAKYLQPLGKPRKFS